jgi:predicted nucleic-acid-binding Zn-ribbon protein
MEKQQYTCPKCGGHEYDVDRMQATGGNFAKLFNVQNKSFSTVICQNCGYTELYSDETSSGMNFIDFLFN